jgi:hypothetical protein
MKILITESQLLTILEQKPPQSVVKSLVKGLVGSTVDKGVSKVDFADLVNKSKQKFDLTKITPSQVAPKKPKWNYDIVKLSDNLQLIRNPKGGGMQYKNSTIKTVLNTKTKEHIDLKWNEDELGKFYYFSANMKNPVDAGRAIETLKKEIPSGSRFGESATGSLSTDSFYSMLRRLRQFTPKVVGYIKLNDSGVKRFQEYIKNVVPKKYHDDGLLFKSIEDATPLLNAINSEIKKSGLGSMANISKNTDNGYYNILIPNIQLYVK